MKIIGCLLIFLICFASPSRAQSPVLDNLFKNSDTTAVLDSLMAEFDNFLDSLSRPRSFVNVSITAGSGLFSFEDVSSVYYSTRRKFLVSPSLGYYHRSGFGLSGSANLLWEGGGLNAYQYVLTPSFDYIKKIFSAGVAYSRYFQKDSLPFYTSPVQNEMYAYFSYKDLWVRPSLTLAYGWGSKSEFERKKISVLKNRSKKKRRSLFITEKSRETVSDLSLILSVRKDFSWIKLFNDKDNLIFCPVIVFNCGTLNYGFNTTYSIVSSGKARGIVLPDGNNINDRSGFQPQSAGLVLKSIYNIDRLMLQPQIYLDYYLQDADQPFTSIFSFTAGINF